MGKKVSRKGKHHETARECIEWVRACLLGGCSIDEAIAALERDGVLLDALLPTDKKEPIHSLCRRIVIACHDDKELGEYFKTLATVAGQVVDVAAGKTKR